MADRIVINGISVSPDDVASMYAGWQSVEKLARQICWSHINKYGLRKGLTADDVMQIAYLTYDRTVRTYDAEKSDDFLGYLYSSIAYDIRLANQVNNKTRMLEECESIDKTQADDEGDRQEIDSIAFGDAKAEAEDNLEKEELCATMDRILSNLCPCDKLTLWEIINDKKVSPSRKKAALRAARREILSATDEEMCILGGFIPSLLIDRSKARTSQ